jgi:transcriptional regulator with XRE-family HTH domain
MRFLRESRGLTQKALAAAVFTSQPAISQWEKNKWLPSKQTQVLLAQELGTTRAFLFSEAGELQRAS